jgi:hypothetical protein
MDVAKSLALRTAAILLAFVIVLAVAPETHAQVTFNITAPSYKVMKEWIKFAAHENAALGGFSPNSGNMITGGCTAGVAVPVYVTNGSTSPLQYLQNTSTDCTFTVRCYSGGCGGGATAIGPSITLNPKPVPVFRLFGFVCPPNADAICLTPVAGSGDWRLQGMQ